MSAPIPPGTDEVALFAARIKGCDCEPDISYAETGPGLYMALVAHDSTCPLAPT